MTDPYTISVPATKSSGSADVLARLRQVNRTERHAVLATDGMGQPYTSLVAYALTDDTRGVIFATPKNTTKYRNIRQNSNVSLLVDTRSNSTKGYLHGEALTILGTAAPVRKSRKRDELTGMFVKKHAALADFVQVPSTALIYVTIREVIHVGQFQVVSKWSSE